MKSVSVSELKARLSQYLEAVQKGERVLVTDRGRPVAALSPVAGPEEKGARVEELMRAGRLRPPSRSLPRSFLRQPRPADPDGRSLAALLEERAEGR